MFRTCLLPLCGFAVLMGGSSAALAQYNSTQSSTPNQLALRYAQELMLNSQRQSSPSTSAARIGLGVGSSMSGSKPFAGYSNGPAVSPYLNLFRVDLGGTNNNYSTLVQPELHQQQVNQQLERQNFQASRRLQAIAAQSDYNPQGSKAEYPTGHQTVFMYFGHYYPATRPRPKKRSQY